MHPSTTRFPPREMGSVAELSAMRAEFVAWLQEVGVDDDRVEDLSVVVSELGANAVRETPAGAGLAMVTAVVDDQHLVVEVSNEVSPGAMSPAEHEWDLTDPLRTGGRGLLLVSAFVDEVDVDVDDGRLVVRCTAAL